MFYVHGGTLTVSGRRFSNFNLIDSKGKTIPVPGLEPETDAEKKQFDGALRRRQLRLILAGKMKAHDATELKALFLNQDEL